MKSIQCKKCKETRDKVEIYRVGEVIREERIRRKMSQEELSYGICAPVTLSRIENNTQKPSLKVEEALLERLGCSTENLVCYASGKEVRKHQLETEMGFLAMNRKPLMEKLQEYRELMTEEGAVSRLEKQFVCMMEAVCGLYTDTWEYEQVYGQLEKSLAFSMPAFPKEGLEKIKLLTHTEIMIVNNMAIVLHKQNKTRQAAEMLSFLIAYMEKGHMSAEAMCKRYPLLLLNRAKIMKELGNYEEVLSLCKKGIYFCTQYSRLAGLPDFYFFYAVALERLGRTEEAADGYECAASLYRIIGSTELAAQSRKKQRELAKCSNTESPVQYPLIRPLTP